MRNTRLIEHVAPVIKHGHIKVFSSEDPSRVLLDQHNLIVSSSEGLFARLMASTGEPLAGVWGLAVGAGQSSWANSSPSTPPPPPTDVSSLYNEVKRKALMTNGVTFLNPDKTNASGQTGLVRFQTLLNATTDNIQVPLMEMGLIGGGQANSAGYVGARYTVVDGAVYDNWTPTDMGTAPYWSATTKDPASVVLINYTTFGSLLLPPGDFIFQWDLQF